MKKNLTPDLKIEDIKSYQEVMLYLKKNDRKKHLLMGNGFSIAYNQEIFSYNALYDFISKLSDPTLSALFKVVNTKNFELIMRELDHFIEISQVLSPENELTDKLKEANKLLQKSLIDAITILHPEHVFNIPDEKNDLCFTFLSDFLDNEGKVFSTNYDLLLYWVLMRNCNDSQKSTDGFGKDVLNPDEVGAQKELSNLYWGKNKEQQNVFHLHGTLPIFDNGIEIEKEVYKNQSYLLNNIKERLEKKEYPVFVTAGGKDEKLKQIMHNKYLTFCYDSLCAIEGSLISFGFNFGEYDEHIIDAINKASKYGCKAGNKLHSVYIGVFSQEDLDHVKSIESKFKCKVNVYKSTTANIWNK
jgi:Domain of unknown function (DUF4917)